MMSLRFLKPSDSCFGMPYIDTTLGLLICHLVRLRSHAGTFNALQNAVICPTLLSCPSSQQIAFSDILFMGTVVIGMIWMAYLSFACSNALQNLLHTVCDLTCLQYQACDVRCLVQLMSIVKEAYTLLICTFRLTTV